MIKMDPGDLVIVRPLEHAMSLPMAKGEQKQIAKDAECLNANAIDAYQSTTGNWLSRLSAMKL